MSVRTRSAPSTLGCPTRRGGRAAGGDLKNRSPGGYLGASFWPLSWRCFGHVHRDEAGQSLPGAKVVLSVVVIDRIALLSRLQLLRERRAAALRPGRCSNIVSTVVAARPPQAHPRFRGARNSGLRCSNRISVFGRDRFEPNHRSASSERLSAAAVKRFGQPLAPSLLHERDGFLEQLKIFRVIHGIGAVDLHPFARRG